MFRGVVIVALLAGLALPATAAAARPGVTTGGVANLTDTSVSLNGSVNPKGKDTQYFFQYGLNKLYGAQTPATAGGAANGGSAVSVPVGALAPATRYHYRLVAVNADGTTLGGDRTFKTKVQPLGLTLKATPSSVPFGSASVISGQLIGTNGRGRQVQLQASAFPYTAGFANVGTPVVTSTVDGTFSFNSIGIRGQHAVPRRDARPPRHHEPDRARGRRRPGQDRHEEGRPGPQEQEDQVLRQHHARR